MSVQHTQQAAQAVSFPSTKKLTERIDQAVEALWLFAIVWIPLVVLSEHQLLSITEMPKIVSLRLIASGVAVLLLSRVIITQFSLLSANTQTDSNPSAGFRTFARRNPVIVAATILLLTQAISTVFSVDPAGSMFGADPGRDGYDLYTLSAYFMMFFAIAISVKERGQIQRIVIAIALAGVLAGAIGVSQRFELAPFGISSTFDEAGQSRVTGTAGNPIIFGSLLTATVPFFLAAMTMAWGKVNARLWTAGVALGLFLIMFPTALTISRGAWLGFAGALVIATVGFFLFFKNCNRHLLVGVAGGIVLTVVMMLLPLPALMSTDFEDGSADLVLGGSSANVAAQSLAARNGSDRIEIWDGSLTIATERPELAAGNNLPSPVRWLVGYGTDMFRFAYPSESAARSVNRLTSTAHNDFINKLVEVGLLGLTAYLLFIAVVAKTVFELLFRPRVNLNLFAKAGVIATAGTFGGLLAAYLTGFPQVSDTTIMWVALGLLAATYRLSNRETEPENPAAKPNSTETKSQPFTPSLTGAGYVLSATVLAVTVMAFAWIQNINVVRADIAAHNAIAAAATDIDGAVRASESATNLAPRSMKYATLHAQALDLKATQATSQREEVEALLAAYHFIEQARERNPLDRDASFHLAHAAWRLAEMGSYEHAVVALETYGYLSELVPKHATVSRLLPQLEQAVAEFDSPAAQSSGNFAAPSE